ncbi:Leucine-rich repeat-containing protein 51 [Dinochytrium kinnereticum]|nr:Leucine-rich repeat-containing protein 51 [Dinochytrium kinnereticum]
MKAPIAGKLGRDNLHNQVTSKLSEKWAVVPKAPLDFSFKDIVNLEAITTAIRLPNNRITSLDHLTSVAMKLGSTLQNIGWIDLSFNCLKTIDKELLHFPNLSTLYLHANEITNLSEIDKLSNFRKLRTLTLHGNPMENAAGYRYNVISRVPGIKHLDFCVITKQDRLTARTLIERMGKRGRGHMGGAGLAGAGGASGDGESSGASGQSAAEAAP